MRTCLYILKKNPFKKFNWKQKILHLCFFTVNFSLCLPLKSISKVFLSLATWVFSSVLQFLDPICWQVLKLNSHASVTSMKIMNLITECLYCSFENYKWNSPSSKDTTYVEAVNGIINYSLTKETWEICWRTKVALDLIFLMAHFSNVVHIENKHKFLPCSLLYIIKRQNLLDKPQIALVGKAWREPNLSPCGWLKQTTGSGALGEPTYSPHFNPLIHGNGL